MSEFVILTVDGAPYEGWKSMSVRYTAKSPERTFEVQASDAGGLLEQAFGFEPGKEVELLATGTLLVKGYIDKLEISFDANAHDLSVSGGSKGKDCVECSAVHDTGEFKDKTILNIANELDKFGIGFESDEELRKVTFRLNNGETMHKALDRIARHQGLFLASKPDGSVNITRHGKNKHAGGIVEGVNLLAGTAHFSEQNRFSDYTVKGQSPIGTKAENTQIKGEVKDGQIKRYRPKIFVAETAVDKQRAKERAEHMKAVAAGEGTRASITTQGFRDDGGTVWEAGWLVYVFSPTLRLDQDMAIESVELSQDDSGGTLSRLEFVDPKALRADQAGGGKQKKSNKKSGGGSPSWSLKW